MFGADMQTSERDISNILMGFVERKISPQTIADVLRAQISEAAVAVESIDGATCNCVLETLSTGVSTDECTDVVFFLSKHPEFPQFLSFQSASGAMRLLLHFFQATAPDNNNAQKKAEELIEQLSAHILHLCQTHRNMDADEKNRLVNVFKSAQPSLVKSLRNSMHFQHLRFMLITPNDYRYDSNLSGTLPQPMEVFSVLLKTPDEALAQNGISYYKTQPFEKNTQFRIQYLTSMLNSLQLHPSTAFKTSFVMEWIFDKALVEAVLFENTTYEYVSALQMLVTQHGTHLPLLYGLFMAIQKDCSFLASRSMQRNSDTGSMLFEKGVQLAENIFPALVTFAQKEFAFVAKHIANWVLDLPVNNEDVRFFKRIHWRWIRSLALGTWDASLRRPPNWVIEAGSVYCASIFHNAHASWLQSYAFILLEKVYQETLVENFSPTEEHYSYVEFLIRALRKKSPFFASRSESLYALHLLGRLTRSESLQYASVEARFQAQLKSYTQHQFHDESPEFALWKEILLNPDVHAVLGHNPVTRALGVLSNVAHETAQKNKEGE